MGRETTDENGEESREEDREEENEAEEDVVTGEARGRLIVTSSIPLLLSMRSTCLFLRAIGLETGAKEPVEATAAIESVVEPWDNSMEILDGILLLVVGRSVLCLAG